MNPNPLLHVLELLKALLDGEFSGVIDETFVHLLENPNNVQDARLGDKGLLVGDSLDLGTLSKADYLSFNFDTSLTSKMEPFVGLTKVQLKKDLRNQPISVLLTATEISEINKGTIEFYTSKLLTIWDNKAKLAFDQLPDKLKTVAYLIYREKNSLTDNFKKRLADGRWLDTAYMLFEGRATDRSIKIGNYLLSYLLPEVPNIDAEKFNAYFAKNILKSVLNITNENELQITFDASNSLSGSNHLAVIGQLKNAVKTKLIFFHPSENSVFYALPDFLYLANGVTYKGFNPKKNIARVLPAVSAIIDQVVQQLIIDIQRIDNESLTHGEKEIELLNLESMAYRRIIIGSFIRAGSHNEGICMDFNLLQTYTDSSALAQDSFEINATQENPAAIKMFQFISDAILTMDSKFFANITFGIPQQNGFLRKNDGVHVFKCLGQPKTTIVLDPKAPRGLSKSEIMNIALRTTINKNTNALIINDAGNHLHFQVTQVGK